MATVEVETEQQKKPEEPGGWRGKKRELFPGTVCKLLIILDYKGFKSGVYRGRIAVMVGCDSEAGEKALPERHWAGRQA